MSNFTTNMSTLSGTSSPPTAPSSRARNGETKHVFSTFIAILSMLGNLLVLIVIIKNRKTYLKKTFYILIITLALVDLVTGAVLSFRSRHVSSVMEPSAGFGLTVYCQLIYSRIMLFIFGKISVFLCLTITIDRWFAICFPTRYPLFSRKQLLALLFLEIMAVTTCIWLQKPPISEEPHNPAGKRCVYGPKNWSLVPTIIALIFLTGLLPFLLIVGLYVHMLYRYNVTAVIGDQQLWQAARKKITIIAAATSCTLIVCWAPNQLYYLLYNLGLVQLGTPFHSFTTFIAMSNSALNPFLYGLLSNDFRKGYWEIMTSLMQGMGKVKRACRSPNCVGPMQATSAGPVRGNDVGVVEADTGRK